MSRITIANKKRLTVLLEVEVAYDGDEYEKARDAAEEAKFIVENATDENWDEYLHVKAVRLRDFR